MGEPHKKNTAAFLLFNRDNIFENLLQAEDHLKRIKNDTRFDDQNQVEALDHIQCVVKHITMAKGESSEAQAHTLDIKEEDYENYMELGERLRHIKDGIASKETTIEDLIRDIREARGFFEKFNPDYDISKCQACGQVESAIASHKRTKKEKVAKAMKDSCENAEDPDYCRKLIAMAERGPDGKEEEFDINKIMKDVRLTTSLLETIGRLSNSIA